MHYGKEGAGGIGGQQYKRDSEERGPAHYAVSGEERVLLGEHKSRNIRHDKMEKNSSTKGTSDRG